MIPSGDKFIECCKITDSIDKMLDTIHNDTMYLSNPSSRCNHPEFLKLVSMGDVIVPYIFHTMTHKGADWTHFYLLQSVTGINPIEPSHCGKYYSIFADWLKWYSQSKYCDRGIYYGLVT